MTEICSCNMISLDNNNNTLSTFKIYQPLSAVCSSPKVISARGGEINGNLRTSWE